MDEIRKGISKECATPEEDIKYKIDAEEEDPEEEYLLYRNGVGTVPRGDLIAITGKVKSGKTFAISIFAAALFGDTSFKFESEMSDDEKVLFFDTEQKKRDVRKVVWRVHKMSGWEPKKNNARFEGYYLKIMPKKDRYEFIRKKIETVKPAAVFIDNIADLIYNFNDSVESNSILENLGQLTADFNCAIFCTLHTNGNERNDKMKGHLGSILTQKASDVFLCSMTGSTFKISEKISRNEKIGEIPFFLKTASDLVMPVLHESYQTEMDREKKEKKDSEKNENVYKIATEICKPGVKYQYGELRGIYMQHTKKSSSTFDRFRDKCVACEFLKRYEGEGNTVFYELIEQSKDADKDLQDEDASVKSTL